ncbi:hypothetical protein GCM10010207_67410 [Streptomyces atratus]|nr:hypothetical protein GCM10010207_67410 [Streptomyces atratus]
MSFHPCRGRLRRGLVAASVAVPTAAAAGPAGRTGTGFDRPGPVAQCCDRGPRRARRRALGHAETIGEPHPLSPGVELSAFRIVQEALSNAMRYAPGAKVRVEIGHHSSAVTVRVINTPPERAAPPSVGAGHGLLGMRERTVMLGGELATGATPDGGYDVTALLPTQPPAHHR